MHLGLRVGLRPIEGFWAQVVARKWTAKDMGAGSESVSLTISVILKGRMGNFRWLLRVDTSRPGHWPVFR